MDEENFYKKKKNINYEKGADDRPADSGPEISS